MIISKTIRVTVTMLLLTWQLLCYSQASISFTDTLTNHVPKNPSKIKEITLVDYFNPTFPCASVLEFKNTETIYLSGKTELKKVNGKYQYVYPSIQFDSSLLRQLPNLRKIYISYFNLNGLNSFEPFKNIKELSIHHSKLDSVPTDIELLKRLVKLNLSNNEISHLPPEIAGLDSLKNINLSNNCLTIIPSGLMGLTNLEELNLGGINEFSATEKPIPVNNINYKWYIKELTDLLNKSSLKNITILITGNYSKSDLLYLLNTTAPVRKINWEFYYPE